MKKYMLLILLMLLFVSCQPQNLTQNAVELEPVEAINEIEEINETDTENETKEINEAEERKENEEINSNNNQDNEEVVNNNEPNVIKEIYMTSMDTGLEYYIKFIKEDTQGKDTYYDRVQIFKVTQGQMDLLYDTIDFNREYEEVYADKDSEDLINIADLDGDGIDEIYLLLENMIYYNFLVLKSFDDQYKDAGTCNCGIDPTYIDVDGDGILEIVSYSSAGNGTSYWAGLDNINEWRNGEYVFSFNLTKLYYEQKISKAKENFEKDKSVKNYVELLGYYGFAGKSNELKQVIEENKPLFKDRLDEFEKYNDHAVNQIGSLHKDYYGYIMYRASNYVILWGRMLKCDTNSTWHVKHRTGYFLEINALKQYGTLYHVVIFQMINDEKIKIFDTDDYDIVVENNHFNYNTDIDIEDRDSDGLDEIYIWTTADKSRQIIVFKLIDDHYQKVFISGSHSYTVDYFDVNDDGNIDLISEYDFDGLGVELSLVYESGAPMYEFSLPLTKDYHHQLKTQYEADFALNKSFESYINLLNIYITLDKNESYEILKNNYKEAFKESVEDFVLGYRHLKNVIPSTYPDYYAYLESRIDNYKEAWLSLEKH